MNTTDADVEKFLKIFTLLDFDVVAGIVANHKQNPELRYGQKPLANSLVTTVYGEAAAQQSINISEVLFGQGDKLQTIKAVSKEDIQALQKETGGCVLNKDQSEWKVLDIFTQS